MYDNAREKRRKEKEGQIADQECSTVCLLVIVNEFLNYPLVWYMYLPTPLHKQDATWGQFLCGI